MDTRAAACILVSHVNIRCLLSSTLTVKETANGHFVLRPIYPITFKDDPLSPSKLAVMKWKSRHKLCAKRLLNWKIENALFRYSTLTLLPWPSRAPCGRTARRGPVFHEAPHLCSSSNRPEFLSWVGGISAMKRRSYCRSFLGSQLPNTNLS